MFPFDDVIMFQSDIGGLHQTDSTTREAELSRSYFGAVVGSTSVAIHSLPHQHYDEQQ